MLLNYKSNSLIKLTRSNLFRIQFIEKIIGGANEKSFERNDSVINKY